ncbi:MAG: winged helix-turn-helix domain-containing protein [Symbiopectobacterium sp.]|uniref:winged helix-turn-helix domain-containing protein n=1 Tax=Symbiopectobacterium sp. TaxID=2952789 RepID=UPI0039EC574D
MEFHQYIFEGFSFNNGQLLTKDKGAIYLAPKESSVLHFMLQNAHSVISKDAIIEHVWKGGLVSDESLTRCIYVLRRALGHSSKKRFIDNIYGKGYRFVPDVQVVDIPARPVSPLVTANNNDITSFDASVTKNACSIALFIFEMQHRYQAISLHDQLIDWLYCLDLPISVVSSFLTRSVQDYSSYMSAIEKSQADYYISGMEIRHGEKSIIRIELTRAKDHSVLYREGVHFTSDHHINYRLLCRAILTLLSIIEPSMGTDSGTVVNLHPPSSPVEQHDALQFSLSELKKFMPQAIKLSGNGKTSISELCRIAGSYYAVANLGLMDYERARHEMMIIVGKILACEPNNVIALSLQGLLLCAENNKEAASKFHLAMLLSPTVAEVYYYYACHLVRQGDLEKAMQMNNMCMELNDSFYSPKILRVIISYLLGDIQEAVRYGEDILNTDSLCNTIMRGLLALLYARLGELCKARALVKYIEEHKLSCEFIGYCYNEVGGGSTP